jgi:hypothetical protein
VVDLTGSLAVIPSEEDPSTVELVSIVDEQLVAAVSATLLAATRLGRLRQLLRRAHPAIAAEWLRILSSVGGRPLPSAASLSASLSLPMGVGDDNGTPSPGRHEMPVRADESQHRREVISGVSGAGPDPRTPEGGALGLAGLGVPPTPAEVEATAQAVLLGLDGAADNATIPLEAATAMAAKLHLPVSDPRLWRALAQAFAGPHAREDETSAVGQDARDREAAGPPEQSLVGRASAPSKATPGRRAEVVRREADIASVLPFLLVGPLDDLGVLDVLTAALAGVGSPDLLTAFAAGLARKALPPPADGWWQPIEVTATIAAFAGQDQPPDGSSMERLGRSMYQWWPVIEEVVTAELIDLRAEDSPLVVTRSPDGLVAADADGLAPLLWDGDPASVRRLWERCGRPIVRADSSLATLLAALGPRNDSAQVDSLADVVAMAVGRPWSGRIDLVSEVDGPISFIANVALAALAWELWHRYGERTHPTMAVRRLGDLDGRVSLEPGRVIVRMPLGRRHADLRDSNLLRTVANVPWLPGRRLEFEGS